MLDRKIPTDCLSPRDIISVALAEAFGHPGGLNLEIVKWDQLANLVVEALGRYHIGFARTAPGKKPTMMSAFTGHSSGVYIEEKTHERDH